MDKFLKYFEDKKFVKWALNSNKELDIYWEYYIVKHPSEKEEVELARLLILQLHSKKESNLGDESINLFSELVRKLDNKSRMLTIRKIGLSVLKYAAVGLLFFSLGITYFYQKSDQFSLLMKQDVLLTDSENVQLILGERKNVEIPEKESLIVCQDNGNIIVNKQDTIQTIIELEVVEMNQLIVPYGKNSSIQLPDGTVASLNAGSRLVYPSRFEGKTREVYLIGEGFFEVTYNENMPFVVRTNDLEVEVLGTKFNLSAYPTDKYIETVLVEGSVKLKESGLQFFKKDYVLEPNQLAVFNRENSETKIIRVDVINYVSWHSGYLNFESSDLSRIIKKLERYYNIQIKLDDPMLGLRVISGKLKLKEETENVLRVLASTAESKLLKLNDNLYVIK